MGDRGAFAMRSQHEAWVRPPGVDPEEAADLLLRDLHSSQHGLSTAEAQRRLVQYGRNELQRHEVRRWPGELVRQLTHPLALLLWIAAILLVAAGSQVVAAAVVVIILLNALFAFVQEIEAERAVEALAQYLPQQATVFRDGAPEQIDAAELVPGDIVIIKEGDRIAADIRLLEGAVEVDMSALTGESVPALRSAAILDVHVPVLTAHDLVFSGTNCTGGEAHGIVFATGMVTELGRIAALSQRVGQDPSPLERQVRRVAWLIAAISVALAVGFIPLAVFAAGLSVVNAVVFAAGLLAGMVPEGLLPVITLALAVAVRVLARRGALVKRLSAVETLGSADVICTDKTGTLTENRMHPIAVWTAAGIVDLDQANARADARLNPPLVASGRIAAACNNAQLGTDGTPPSGDPTEIAVLLAAHTLGADLDTATRESQRSWQFHFDPEIKLMSTIDREDGRLAIHTKGAPEAVLPHCTVFLDADGQRTLTSEQRARITTQVDRFAAGGLRVLALAQRDLPEHKRAPHRRADAEHDLCFVGLIAMLDPPRAGVTDAVARCRSAGIKIIVITGDHPLTAAAIARRVGITSQDPTVVNGDQLEQFGEDALKDLLHHEPEIVFARASPEIKLHVADALREQGHVVAMTGDGVNDAPALRRADIGVAMGRSGTDVAREAATMVLTDDSFASIVAAVRAGRQIYDNVRKFIIYIFAHATPEVVTFLLFALGGGLIPLPLTILQLLAFDVGSETMPALALSREPAEPGLMNRPPRPRSEGVIRGPMLVRSWLFLGVLVSVLSLAGFFYVLTSAGWSLGAPVGPGQPLHHAYQQATTMTFLGMIAGQVGTAFAVRTQQASLRSTGVLSNRFLLAAIGGEILLAAVFVYTPPFQALLGTAALPPSNLLILFFYPFVVWGADELRRYILRARSRNSA